MIRLFLTLDVSVAFEYVCFICLRIIIVDLDIWIRVKFS